MYMRTEMKKTILKMIVTACILLAGTGGICAEAAARISLNYQSFLMKKGQNFTLKLQNAQKVVWKSSDSRIASVSSTGKVQAKKAGTATITASYKKKNYTCSVTVSDGKKKSLVVYFSATGTTKSAAKKVAKAAGADLLRLMPKNKYTAEDLDYGNENSRATKEQNRPSARPAMATGMKNLSQYKAVYLGYPIWWGKEPRLIRTFLDKYSMKGKTVIPFCTSGSSGISGSMSGIRKGAGGGTVKAGKDLTGWSQKKVSAWVEKVGLKESRELKLMIDGAEVPVTWEENPSVEALKDLVGNQVLTIDLSRYGGFEQVGDLGQELPGADQSVTTAPGDIVLYSGDQIVLFYGSNTWEYTRLGKISGYTEQGLRTLLGKKNVKIRLSLA